MRLVRGLKRACLAFVAINGIFAVHETGHLLAARWARVTVRGFSLGIGPAILHRTIGGTAYAVRAIPLGAYVDLATGPETVIIGSLDRVSPWAQAGIFAAGPLVNIVFGLVVILLLHPHLDSLDASPASSARILGPIGVLGALARNMGRDWRSATVAAGVLSVDIGLSNLIPLPPLDGGKILWLGVKHVFRVGPKVELWVILITTALLLLVVIETVVADLRRQLAQRRATPTHDYSVTPMLVPCECGHFTYRGFPRCEYCGGVNFAYRPPREAEKINEAIVQYFGQPMKVRCDRECNKAWGMHTRPTENGAWLSDTELGEAPADPGTYEGDSGKPLSPDAFPTKWCVRECERCASSHLGESGLPLALPDLSRRHPWP